MPTPTYTPLATVTLGSATSSVTFGSIPSTYRDLIVVVSGTSNEIVNIAVRLNGDTGTNYSWINAIGTGSSTISEGEASTALPEVGRFSSTQSNFIVQVMDYSATDKHKTMLGRANSNGDRTVMNATRWANTVAVSSLTLRSFPSPRTFSSGTTFSLYGVIA